MTILSGGQNNTAATLVSPTAAVQRRSGHDTSRPGHIGWVVAGSLATGVVAALLLGAAPFIPATESGVTGAILVGLSLGWATLAVLSVRFTDQPQEWAAAPALFMGLGGAVLMIFSSPAQTVLAWVWPPVLLTLAVWMFVQARRQLRSRSARFLLLPVIAMMVLASLGGGFETVRAAGGTATAPYEGRLIDVGGHRLYLECTGSGSPTVVLEPGGGGMSSDLGLIAPAVADDTRVCVYDRAGRGRSDTTETPQDGARIADDLHTLLQRADVPGPYILAGHSFGGLYVLAFAVQYPEDVAGLVLVDSTAPASAPGSTSSVGPDPATDDTMNRVSAVASGATRLGLGPIFGVTSDHLRSTINEYIRAGSSAQQAAALKNVGDKPLVVLTASVGNQEGWNASQESLASLSTNSLHRIIDGATHASFITDQDDAAAASRAILDVVAAVQTASPLIP